MHMQNAFNKYMVIDFTTGDAGPVCSENLAMLGFNVIRVDRMADEKLDRHIFINENLNKKCITLNTDTEKGKELFKKLVEKADVLVENYPLGYMEKMGFGYEDVKKYNSNIIYASLKPYPKGSKWENLKADEATMSAMAGSSYLTGYIGNDPVQPGPNLANIITCASAATGILSALFRRETTGEGQLVEVSQMEAIICQARSAYEFYKNRGINYRLGNCFPTMPEMIPMDLYPAKGEGDDDWVIVGCFNEGVWQKLLKVMGKEELINDPDFNTVPARYKNREKINKMISDFTRQHDKIELMDLLLRQNEIVCSAVFSIEDIINAQDLRKMGLMQKVEDQELGEMWLPSFPGIYSAFDIKLETPKNIGAANKEVYSGVLGLSEDEITKLNSAKVI